MVKRISLLSVIILVAASIGGMSTAAEQSAPTPPEAQPTDADAASPAWWLANALGETPSITDPAVRSSAYADIARAQASGSMVDNALKTAANIEDADLKLRTLRQMSEILRWEKGARVKVLPAVAAEAEKIKDPEEKALHLYWVAGDYEENGNIDEATKCYIEAADVAKAAGVRPDVVEDIATYLARMGKKEEGDKVFPGARSHEQRSKEHMDINAVNDEAIKKAQVGDVEGMKEILKQLGEGRIAYYEITHALLYPGKYRVAIELVTEIKSPVTRAWVAINLADSLANMQSVPAEDVVNTLSQAIPTVVKMKDELPWYTSRVTEILMRIGKSDMALATAMQMEDVSRRVTALTIITEGIGQPRTPEPADLLKDVSDTIDKAEDGWQKADLLRAKGTLLNRHGQKDEAAQALSDAVTAADNEKDSNARLRSLTSIAKEQANASEGEECMTTLNLAVAVAASIKDPRARAGWLATIALAQYNVKQNDEAVKTFTFAITAAQEIEESYHRRDTLEQIARAQLQAGMNEAAARTRALTVTLPPAEWDRFSFDKPEKYPDTLADIAVVRDPIIRAAALQQLVYGWSLSDNLPQDPKWFTQVSDIAKGLEHGPARAWVYVYSAMILLKANDPKAASQAIAEAVNDAIAEKGTRAERELLYNIAQTTAKAGMTDSLAETLKSLKDEPPQARVWFSIGAAEGLLEKAAAEKP